MGKLAEKTQATAEKIKKQNDIFVKLEDKDDRVVGIFLGDAAAEEQFWNPKTGKPEPYTQEHADKGLRSSAKFTINFYTIADGDADKLKELDTPTVKILSLNNKDYRKYVKVKERYCSAGSFRYFEIERKGPKGEAADMSILPEDSDKRPVSDDLKSQLRRAEEAHEAFIERGTKVPDGVISMHDLEKEARRDGADDPKKGSGGGGGGSGGGSTRAPEGIPADVINGIKSRLKALPKREDIDKFLSKFGVSQIKDLKPSDKDGALAFIVELEGGAVPTGKKDPFADE